jgi:DNA repair exonuclease SbcCD ATPase subunit
MNDKERLQEIREKQEKCKAGETFWSISFDDVDWLIEQAEKVKQLQQEINFLKASDEYGFELNQIARRDYRKLEKKFQQAQSALREIDTHIRSTPDPIPYIIETLKRSLPEYK